MTPRELAAELGISDRAVRRWMRTSYPRTPDEKYARYVLTPDQVKAARLVLTPTALAASAYHEVWHWEGNVQSVIAAYLTSVGWRVVSMADAGSKEHGDDIRAQRGDRTLRVEVKGFPSADYADARRAGEQKRTRPSTQAGHWFSQALLRAMKDKHVYPDEEAAIGLPDFQRFRDLVAATERPLRTLAIGVYLVHESGGVELLLPHSRLHGYE